MTQTITYEQPLNERNRTLLRLEFLFGQTLHALQGDSVNHHRQAIDCLLDILSLFDRTDLKTEITKEMERLIAGLSALASNPKVDAAILTDLLADLEQNLAVLQQLKTKNALGHALRDSEFLAPIRQRASVPAGTSHVDLPAYHYWLSHTPAEQRHQQITHWFDGFTPARTATEDCLDLIRNSATSSNKIAAEGFYQQTLDANHPYQLVRVTLPAGAIYFPEISGGKHRFTVRFMVFDLDDRPQQTTDDVEFTLSCCAL